MKPAWIGRVVGIRNEMHSVDAPEHGELAHARASAAVANAVFDRSATLRSPSYWIQPEDNLSEDASEAEALEERMLADLDRQPDELSGLFDVRDYVPARPRRVSRRIRAPRRCFHVTRQGQLAALDITILLRDQHMRCVDAFLYDVNDGGIGIACPEPAAVGSEVIVCAAHEADPSPVVAAPAKVLNQREFPGDPNCPDRFAGEELWILGFHTEQRDARVLLKATLDSLAQEVAGWPELRARRSAG